MPGTKETQARRAERILERSWDDDVEIRDGVKRGDFEVQTEPSGQRRFWFCCPGPCGSVAGIAIRPVVGKDEPSWAFDENLDAPTLHPSINHVGCWHGWLKAGVFASC